MAGKVSLKLTVPAEVMATVRKLRAARANQKCLVGWAGQKVRVVFVKAELPVDPISSFERSVFVEVL